MISRIRAGYLLGALLLLIVLAVVGLGWLGFLYFYTPGLQATLRGHQGEDICLAFGPDGNTLASGGQDGTVRLWDLSTRKERAILTGHTHIILDVAFSPDGKLVASASRDGSVRVWDSGTGREHYVLNAQAKGDGKPLQVFTIAFSPDGTLLASGGSDKTIRLWEVATGKQRPVLQAGKDVRSLAITADGKLLVSRTDDGTITVSELDGGKELRHFGEWHIGGPPRLSSILLGPDGKTLASNGESNEKVRLWDLTSGEQTATLKADLTWQNWPIYAMAFTPDGKILAGTTMFGARMIFWNTSSGELLGIIHFPGRTRSIALSPDGKTLASAHGDGTVKLWEWEKLVPKN